MPLFWTFGVVSPRFQNQSVQPYSHGSWVYLSTYLQTYIGGGSILGPQYFGFGSPTPNENYQETFDLSSRRIRPPLKLSGRTYAHGNCVWRLTVACIADIVLYLCSNSLDFVIQFCEIWYHWDTSLSPCTYVSTSFSFHAVFGKKLPNNTLVSPPLVLKPFLLLLSV